MKDIWLFSKSSVLLCLPFPTLLEAPRNVSRSEMPHLKTLCTRQDCWHFTRSQIKPHLQAGWEKLFSKISELILRELTPVRPQIPPITVLASQPDFAQAVLQPGQCHHCSYSQLTKAGAHLSWKCSDPLERRMLVWRDCGWVRVLVSGCFCQQQGSL